MNDWHQERQLYASPYSGCRSFTGWAPAPPGCKIPKNTTWPSAHNAPGALACVDRGRRPCSGPQKLQRVHFRPSAPYPSWILGPGGEPLKPMCNVPNQWVLKPGKPPYNLRALAFPSTTGPWTTRITGGISGNLPDAAICGIGQFSQHNLGWS